MQSQQEFYPHNMHCECISCEARREERPDEQDILDQWVEDTMMEVIDSEGEHRIDNVSLPEGGFSIVDGSEGELTEEEWEEQARIHLATLGY